MKMRNIRAARPSLDHSRFQVSVVNMPRKPGSTDNEPLILVKYTFQLRRSSKLLETTPNYTFARFFDFS